MTSTDVASNAVALHAGSLAICLLKNNQLLPMSVQVHGSSVGMIETVRPQMLMIHCPVISAAIIRVPSFQCTQHMVDLSA